MKVLSLCGVLENLFEWGFVVLKPLENSFLAEVQTSPFAFLGKLQMSSGSLSTHSYVYKSFFLCFQYSLKQMYHVDKLFLLYVICN